MTGCPDWQNRINKTPRLYLDGWYMVNRYLLRYRFPGQKKDRKKERYRYRLICNTTIPENMIDYYQWWCDPTIQHFRIYESSEFMCASVEVIKPGVPYDINQAYLNKKIICVGDESYLDQYFMVQVATDFYYKYLKLCQYHVW